MYACWTCLFCDQSRFLPWEFADGGDPHQGLANHSGRDPAARYPISIGGTACLGGWAPLFVATRPETNRNSRKMLELLRTATLLVAHASSQQARPSVPSSGGTGAATASRASRCPAAHTLMAQFNYSGVELAACEDLRGRNGSLVFVATGAEQAGRSHDGPPGPLALPLTLAKRVEYMAFDPQTDNDYLGWSKHEVMTNATDLLGNFLLGVHGHPHRSEEASLREVSDAIPPIRSINTARVCTANRESGRDACFDEKGTAPTWSGTPDPQTVSADQPLDGQLADEMRIPKPASFEFDGEGLLGGDLPILVLDFPVANKNDSLWEMTIVPQANNTGREQPVFIRFVHVNASAARGDARPSTLYFDSYEYNPSLGCPLGSENPKTLVNHL